MIEHHEASTLPPQDPPARPPGLLAQGFIAAAGIILPLVTLVTEYVTGMSASESLDPIPTWFHVLLIATVPLANAMLLRALRPGQPALSRGWMRLHGVAIGISAFYALLFLPMTLIGVVAILFMGMGLLPLAPLLSLIAALVGRRQLKRLALAQGAAPPPSLWPGVALGLAALVVVGLPSTVTRLGMHMATAPAADTSASGVRWLRRLGSEDVMLRMCYLDTGVSTDLLGKLFDLDQRIGTDQARVIFYRVTGTPFNIRPSPLQGKGRTWGDIFDADAGGSEVGGRMDGVRLASSRMDGSLDAGAALGYLEWTMVFRNDSTANQEGRAQVLLPAGAVVSRVTLWIDGEEREAAFGGRAQVRQAYQKVVRVNRDPVLVTTSGKDRVMVQLFPIPPNGGEMKVRIGVTAPLVMNELAQGYLQLPSFSERNFEIAPSLRHAVWIESRGALQGAPGMREEHGPALPFSVRGDVAEPLPGLGAAIITAKRAPQETLAWSEDPHGKNGVVVQTISRQPARIPGRVALVIDGSVSLNAQKEQLARAATAFPANVEVGIIVADDRAPQVFLHDASNSLATVRHLQDVDFEGGRDNNAALVAAWEWAAAASDGAIVWIHGPQPVLLDTAEALLQRYQRRPGQVRLYELEALAGTNLIGRKMDGIVPVVNVPRIGALHDDLARLLGGWRPNAQQTVVERKRGGDSAPPAAAKTSQHLTRLWAAGQVALLSATDDPARLAAATDLARQYQLVTPVTGAVVLETQKEYDEAGLEPVEPGSVPTIPEPETWLMMLVALAVLGWRLRYHKRTPFPVSAR